jgi:hypothetical protein
VLGYYVINEPRVSNFICIDRLKSDLSQSEIYVQLNPLISYALCNFVGSCYELTNGLVISSNIIISTIDD